MFLRQASGQIGANIFIFAKNSFGIGEFRNEIHFLEFPIDLELEGAAPPPKKIISKSWWWKKIFFYKLRYSYMYECMVKKWPKNIHY